MLAVLEYQPYEILFTITSNTHNSCTWTYDYTSFWVEDISPQITQIKNSRVSISILNYPIYDFYKIV